MVKAKLAMLDKNFKLAENLLLEQVMRAKIRDSTRWGESVFAQGLRRRSDANVSRPSHVGRVSRRRRSKSEEKPNRNEKNDAINLFRVTTSWKISKFPTTSICLIADKKRKPEK